MLFLQAIIRYTTIETVYKLTAATDSLFKVTFWGTRGTRQIHKLDQIKFGTNTICVEVQCGNRILVFDAGSGIIDFGEDFENRNAAHSFDLFFTHAHYDHVEGIPYLSPLYSNKYSTNIWAGKLKGVEACHEIFDLLMMRPYFPVNVEKFKADIKYNDITDYETLDIGDGIVIKTTRLNHPGGATGYRVEYAGKSFGFITDCSHTVDKCDAELVRFLKGVNLFAYDCSYTDDEFTNFSSYGHSSWQEALRLQAAATANAVYAVHHMPFRTDEELEEIHAQMQASNKNCGVACDREVIFL